MQFFVPELRFLRIAPGGPLSPTGELGQLLHAAWQETEPSAVAESVKQTTGSYNRVSVLSVEINGACIRVPCSPCIFIAAHRSIPMHQ